MAQVYSAKAPHLTTLHQTPYRPGLGSVVFLALIPAAVLGYVMQTFAYDVSPTARWILFILLYVVSFPILLQSYVDYRRRHSHRFPFSAMHSRENSVLGQLSALPENFSVFHRIELPDHRPIHFVVTSDNCIFAIRVKYVWGIVGFDGHELTHNWEEMNDGDLVHQTIAHARHLEKYLKDRLYQEFHVQPVLVFSEDTIVTNLTSWEMKERGIQILRAGYLDDYLTGHSPGGPDFDVQKVNHALLSLMVR